MSQYSDAVLSSYDNLFQAAGQAYLVRHP